MNKNISASSRTALGMGFFASFFAAQGIHILAVPYYQMTLGVDPFILSLMITLPLLLGASVGPVVGHLSDSCSSRWGRRRPFLFVACWFVGLSYGALWMVPATWSEPSQLLYFAIVATLFYVATAFYTVPLNSLTYELTDSYHERTEIIGFTAYFVKFGSLIYQWVFPITQLSVFGSVYVGIKAVGWGIGVLIFGCCGVLPAIFTRENRYRAFSPARGHKFISSLKRVLRNPEMLRLVCLTFLQMGGGACVAMLDYNLLVYYVHDGDVGEGAFWKAVLSTSFAVMSILLVPVVTHLSYALGKLPALKIIYIITAFGGFAKWFIFKPDATWIIALDALLCSGIWVAMVVLIPSMLADVSQEDNKKSREGHTGIYASIYGWVVSFSGVAAFIIYGLTLNMVGFEAALGGAQDESTILSLRIVLAGGTILFSVLPLVILHFWKFETERERAGVRI